MDGRRIVRLSFVTSLILTMALLAAAPLPVGKVAATPPPELWDVNDGFNGPNLDSSLWVVPPPKDGDPAFGYTVGTWPAMGADTWVCCQSILGGTATHNGYFFTTILGAPYRKDYVIETEIGWAASRNWPVYYVYLVLKDTSDNVKVRVGYYDAWAENTGLKYAEIEGSVITSTRLPMTGRGILKVERDANNLVSIYWDGVLLKQGSSTSPIAKIQLHIRGHKSYREGAAGFNYLQAYDPRRTASNEISESFGGPYIDTSLWQVKRANHPTFSYSIGAWDGSGSWLKSDQMTGGDSGAYNGYAFNHYLSGLTNSFTVQTRLAWKASGDNPIYNVYLILRDGSENTKIQVGYWDAWAGSLRRKYALIEGVSNYWDGLPLSGQANIEVVRDTSNLVTIKWDNVILLQVTCAAEIKKVVLYFTGHSSYQGGYAGFDYLYSQLGAPSRVLPTGDAHIREDTPDTNYNLGYLNARYYQYCSERAYLQFQIPDRHLVTKATLHAYCYAFYGSGRGTKIIAYSAPPGWNEGTLTWNLAEANYNLWIFLDEDTSGAINSWDDWDVTGLAQSADQITIVLVCIGTLDNQGAHYYSKDYTNSVYYPYIEFEMEAIAEVPPKRVSSDFFNGLELSSAWQVSPIGYQPTPWNWYLEGWRYLCFSSAADPPLGPYYFSGYKFDQNDLNYGGAFCFTSGMWSCYEDAVGQDDYFRLSFEAHGSQGMIAQVQRCRDPSGDIIKVTAGTQTNQIAIDDPMYPSGCFFTSKIYRHPSGVTTVTVSAGNSAEYTYQSVEVASDEVATVKVVTLRISIEIWHPSQYSTPASAKVDYVTEERVIWMRNCDPTTNPPGESFEGVIRNSGFSLDSLTYWTEEPSDSGYRVVEGSADYWYVSGPVKQRTFYGLSQNLEDHFDNYGKFKFDSLKGQRVVFSFHAKRGDTASAMRAVITYWTASHPSQCTVVSGQWVELSSTFTTIEAATSAPLPQDLTALKVTIEGLPSGYSPNPYFSAYMDLTRVSIKDDTYLDSQQLTLYVARCGVLTAGLSVSRATITDETLDVRVHPTVKVEGLDVGIATIRIDFEILSGGPHSHTATVPIHGTTETNQWAGGTYVFSDQERQHQKESLECLVAAIDNGIDLLSLAFSLPGEVAALFVQSLLNFPVEYLLDLYYSDAQDREAELGSPGYQSWTYPWDVVNGFVRPFVAEGNLELACASTKANLGGYFELRVTFSVDFWYDVYLADVFSTSTRLVIGPFS